MARLPIAIAVTACALAAIAIAACLMVDRVSVERGARDPITVTVEMRRFRPGGEDDVCYDFERELTTRP